MNKRAAALIFSLLVSVVLTILLSSFFIKTINENNLVKRYVNSVRAFWAAEAGLADGIDNLTNSGSGSLGSYTYQWTTTLRTTISSVDYYDIVATGTVPLAAGGSITRTVSGVVRREPVDPSKFKYGLQAANDLCFGGACNKPASDYVIDPTPPDSPCPTGICWEEFDDTINFTDMFGQAQADIQAMATTYTDANFPGTISGVTWVDVAAGNTLMATGSETGSGILIINGNVHFGGTYQFHGIIYVLGTMVARGTFDAYGSVIVASSAGVDSINGTPEFHYDQDDITAALQQINTDKEIVSWKED